MNTARNEIIPLWPRIVGPVLARAATPVAVLCEDCLVIRAASHAWAGELRGMTRQILDRVNALRTSDVPFRRLQVLSRPSTPIPNRT